MVRSKFLMRSGVAIFFATTLLLRAGSPDAADTGYLANVGPSPLRFLGPAKPFKSLAISPPEIETNESKKTKTPSASAAEIAPPPTTLPESDAAAAQTNVIAAPNPTDSIAGSESNQDQTISPQMLLKYFNKPAVSDPTPAAPIAPTAPVQFQAPPVAPSSKATYSISP